MKYEVLLFYKYVHIEDPQVLKESQRALCEKLGLTGRIIIAEEGINGTLEGAKEATTAYCEALLSDPRFADIHFKKSVGTGHAFPRLSIKVRKDIVSNALTNIETPSVKVDPRATTGKRLSPEELRKWLKERPGTFHIVDMRNDYEYRVGHFDGSIFSGMKNFRDLPETAQKISHLQDKTVVTVCTGGVRCEKASGFLIKEGFKNVYQLNGGIVSYMEKYPGEDFIGSLYVFDNRITMNFDDPATHKPVGKCDICQKPSEKYANCSLDTCHNHFICCEECRGSQNGYSFCSKPCQEEYQKQQKTQEIGHIYTT